MNSCIKSLELAVFCIAVVLVAGCLPEPGNSLDWSEDGSIGLIRIEDALYLVYGQTGELTEIEKTNVQPWPCISRDGKLIAYSQVVECNDLSEGLNQLPAGQVKIIKNTVQKMREDILKAGGLADGKFHGSDGFFKNWTIRYLCENADAELRKILKAEDIQKAKEEALSFFQIVIVPKDNLKDKRVITTSALKIMATQLSPDCSSIAYLMSQKIEKVEDPMYALYVASIQSDIKAMHIDDNIAFSYDWRKDSKAIVYIKSDFEEDYAASGSMLGSLVERTIADVNGTLIGELYGGSDNELLMRTHNCTGKAESLVGLYFFPWLKAQYGPSERIFFSSANWSLPVSKKESVEDWSLFCYDSLIGTVTDVLPSNVKSDMGGSVYVIQFSMSPDGKKALLPITQNNFIIYEFGKEPKKIVFKEQGGGGEDVPELFPSWKGNNEISCFASADSKLFTEEVRDKFKNDEDEQVVILDANGKFKQVLSRSWEDKIEKTPADKSN
jgi:hypothetical protein